MKILSNLETVTPTRALFTVAMVMQQQCLAVQTAFSHTLCSFHSTRCGFLSKFSPQRRWAGSMYTYRREGSHMDAGVGLHACLSEARWHDSACVTVNTASCWALPLMCLSAFWEDQHSQAHAHSSSLDLKSDIIAGLEELPPHPDELSCTSWHI